MPGLAELQQELVAALLDGDDTVSDRLLGDPALDVQGRLAVYQGSVRGALSRALTQVYPVLQRLVGARFFDAMAGRYLAAHPSTSPDLHDFGGQLAPFLASFAPAAALPYLPDVARLEWAWHRVFHAADPDPGLPAGFGDRDEDALAALPLALSPALRLVHSDYPVDQIWRANQPEQEEPPAVHLDEGPVWLVVSRGGGLPEIENLNPRDWQLLDAIADSACLDDLAGLEPALDQRLPPLLARGWIRIPSASSPHTPAAAQAPAGSQQPEPGPGQS